MMRIFRIEEREKYSEVLNRELEFEEYIEKVRPIVEDVAENGDEALLRYTEIFDGVKISSISVKEEEIENAYESIDEELLNAIYYAHDNIYAFHKKQMPPKIWFEEIRKGIFVGQKISPLRTVGIYVPGGRAAYPSSVLMNAVPASVAGVRNIVMCTPPSRDGTIHPLTLVAADIAGVDEIYRVGGAQAIAAMAYGTESVREVDKIVGPGNIYVTAAKILVRGKCEIDFPAGPSEVLILADESSSPRLVASEILSQAEHDPMAQSIALLNSERMAETVREIVESEARGSPRSEILSESLKNSLILLYSSKDEAINFINDYAPEHLVLMTSDPLEDLEKVENAGAVFLGDFSPVASGDYCSGANHVLPTNGASRIYSGLNVEHFIKRISVQHITEEGLRNMKDAVIKLAEAEGLYEHAKSVKWRFE
ncbi:MAG: histidinol dehydrogenase [Archaeoglobi archaeon]|nr:histidinol dehydrogenase [Archaeoglobi archaeon]MDK2781323.1 histidinol dehydrogenase [Archaeoglobi archaeon]